MIPLLAQRAVADSPRWTRAVGIIPPTPFLIVCYGDGNWLIRFLRGLA